MSDTRPPMPPALLRNLCASVASVISDFKAHEVPALCRRLGLADGTEQEAFGSKFKYAQKRLVDVDGARLVKIARELLGEVEDFALGEIVSKIDELGGQQVSLLTRRRLLSLLGGHPLSTEVDDLEFIRSVWPIARMAPRYEGRASLEEDIIRHTVANHDWSQRELLESLGFMTCSRGLLFRFLEALTAPESQSPDRQRLLAQEIASVLAHDGYALVVAGTISGAPKYAVRVAPSGAPSDKTVADALAAFDPIHVRSRWQQAMDRRASDSEGAITLARTLLEDVCKWILHEAREEWRETDDLPALYRKLAKVLKLAPDDHAEQVFKQILGSCQSVVESLGALRNKLGDAHSSGPKRARPLPRHAELAVNLSGAMSSFLVATWESRKAEASKSGSV